MPGGRPAKRRAGATARERKAKQRASDEYRRRKQEQDVTAREITVPEVTAPEVTAPEVAVPEVAVPEVAAPEVAAPEVAAPEVAVPEVAAPEVAAPEVAAPEVAAPEVAAPEVTEPQVAGPSRISHQEVRAEIKTPRGRPAKKGTSGTARERKAKQRASEKYRQRKWEQDATTAEVAEPKVAEPEIAEPEIVEPEVAEPEVAEPEVAEPEVAEPEVAEPQVAGPSRIARQEEIRTESETPRGRPSKRRAASPVATTMERKKKQRADEEFRRRERERDAAARQAAREVAGPSRTREQQRDTRAHRITRQEEEIRATQRTRDAEARRISREDEERRAEETARNTEARRIARQDEQRLIEERRALVERRQSIRSRGAHFLYALEKHHDDDVDLHYVGPFTSTCQYCEAKHFLAEKVGDGFSLCCHKGKVILEPLTVPDELRNIIENNDETTRMYLEHIRVYNSSLAFASMVANLSAPTRRGPFCFRIHGQIHHYLSAIREPHADKRYATLYFMDTEQSLQERLQHAENRHVNEELMRRLLNIIITVNPFANSFKIMKEVEDEENAAAEREGREILPVTMMFTTDPVSDARRYNKPTASGIAVVFTGNDGEPPHQRALIVHSRDDGRRILPNVHECKDPMVYPLLFPCGEYGWHVGLEHVPERRTARQHRITPLQFYSYRLACRGDFSLLHSSGKLFQQFIVDSYVTVESQRLLFIRNNQKQLRVEKYQGLMDYVQNRAEQEGVTPGKMVILPSTFIGSKRNVQQRYQDAMAIVRKLGKPDLFITFTCNPSWPEITDNLKPWETSNDRPDIVARVFHLKLKELLEDITKKHIFGKTIAYVYTTEFQKRGLPHIHLLLILDAEHKPRDEEVIDKIVSAELPDDSPRLFDIVGTCMIHGVCGELNPTASCMEDGKCTKGFPKDFAENTLANVNGYPVYRRRNDGKTVRKITRGGAVDVDNRWVVPYNPYLSLKFNTHINVEVCSTVKAVKYLFKYIYKGYDCANIRITQRAQGEDMEWNEISTYLDSRFVSAPEGVWRLYEFEMQAQSHIIIRLALHLPMEQNVIFVGGEEEEAILREANKDTMLTAYFKLNQTDPAARQLYYMDIPNHYVWNVSTKSWKERQRGSGNVIGRMYSASPSQQELFFLRLLLLHVKGAESFQDLRTVNGTVCETFREAARSLNLLDDDTEWERCLREVSTFKMPHEMRNVFVLICIHCNPQDPKQLWNRYKDDFVEDYARTHDPEAATNHALADIERMLRRHGKTCASFELPSPDLDAIAEERHVVVDIARERELGEEMLSNLNDNQRAIVIEILTAVREETGPNVFFVDGPGGTGKTYMYQCLMHVLQGEEKTVIAVAWTGIAANLLPNGRTAHSMFRFPVPLFDNSVSQISRNSPQADVLRSCSLILWDEASMADSCALVVLDRLLKDLTGKNDLFGGKVVVFGGDFRQVLPVVKHGSRTTIVESSMKSWTSWGDVRQLKLTKNMRAAVGHDEFSDWLLKLGNGTLEAVEDAAENTIEIPRQCVVEHDLIEEIFGSEISPDDFDDFKNNVILCPKNEHCFEINDRVVDRVLIGTSKTYYSVDSVVCDDDVEADDIPLEYIHSLTPAGLPPHKLSLKIGTIVMLTRNIDVKRNLVNGLRLRVTQLHENIIEVSRLDGAERILIPRTDLVPTDLDMPFQIKRRQFPIRIAFAMTINKAQGQTFRKIGLYLPQPVFSHGQLYVAFSRVSRLEDIKVKVSHCYGQGKTRAGVWYTKNVVYKEILDA